MSIRKYIKSPTQLVAILSVALVGGVALLVSAMAQENTQLPPAKDTAGNIVEDGIVEMQKVTLGGVDQWILVRGQSHDNPVLLFLHGGPGGAIMPWVDLFQTSELEEHFTIVHWDQRGSGKSFSPELTVDDVRPEKFVSDTLELTTYLQKWFGKEKIFLTGQSWGSALGFMVIAEDSSSYHAFIPTSERVHWHRSLKMGYEWAVEQAKANSHDDILKRLQAIEPFDALDETDLAVQKEVLDYYRGGDYHTEGLGPKYLDYALSGQSPYYSDEDIQKYMPGLELSSRGVEVPEIVGNYDLFKSHPSVDIPVHFIVGADDHNTPADLAREYYEFVQAPQKSFTAIDEAAHMVMFDQPDFWAEAIINIKKQTLGENLESRDD